MKTTRWGAFRARTVHGRPARRLPPGAGSDEHAIVSVTDTQVSWQSSAPLADPARPLPGPDRTRGSQRAWRRLREPESWGTTPSAGGEAAGKGTAEPRPCLGRAPLPPPFSPRPGRSLRSRLLTQTPWQPPQWPSGGRGRLTSRREDLAALAVELPLGAAWRGLYPRSGSVHARGLRPDAPCVCAWPPRQGRGGRASPGGGAHMLSGPAPMLQSRPAHSSPSHPATQGPRASGHWEPGFAPAAGRAPDVSSPEPVLPRPAWPRRARALAGFTDSNAARIARCKRKRGQRTLLETCPASSVTPRCTETSLEAAAAVRGRQCEASSGPGSFQAAGLTPSGLWVAGWWPGDAVSCPPSHNLLGGTKDGIYL